MLNGPDIRRLFKDTEFEQCLTAEEAVAWDNLRAVIDGVLGIHRIVGWNVLVENMLESFEKIKVNMSLKVHFMHHHQDQFQMQLPTESDQHGERFHQVTAQLEHWYNGKRLNSLLADICWNLQLDDESDKD